MNSFVQKQKGENFLLQTAFLADTYVGIVRLDKAMRGEMVFASILIEPNENSNTCIIVLTEQVDPEEDFSAEQTQFLPPIAWKKFN